MRTSSTFKIAFRSMSRNKVRTFLTMLGIIIGVASVIAMLAIGQGAKNAVRDQISSLGANVVMVMPGAFSPGGVRQEAGSASRLTEKDAVLIKLHCPSVRYASPQVRTVTQVKYLNQNWRTSIQGVYPEFLSIRDWPVDRGAAFTESEQRTSAKICLLGVTVARNLFGENADPVGQTLRIKNMPFRVVGILSAKGQNMMGQDQDDVILAPFSTVQKRLIGTTYAWSVIASAYDDQGIDEAVAEIRKLFQSPLGGSRGPDDFTVRTQTEIAATASQTTDIMSALLAGIAAVSLLVGGIGIMNIMLVSVAERTREIGIRMAVGARGGDILMQFLVEAAVISLAGGVIGIVLGWAISLIIAMTQGWPAAVTVFSVFLGFGFSAVVGIFFGWYPARKAAGLNPIEALRYE